MQNLLWAVALAVSAIYSNEIQYINKANPDQAARPLITALGVTSLVIRLLTGREQQARQVNQAVKD